MVSERTWSVNRANMVSEHVACGSGMTGGAAGFRPVVRYRTARLSSDAGAALADGGAVPADLFKLTWRMDAEYGGSDV